MRYFIFFALACCLAISTNAQPGKNNKAGVPLQKSQQPFAATLKLYPKTADKYVNVYVETDTITDIKITIPGTPLSNEVSWELYGRTSYQKNVDITMLYPGVYTVIVTAPGIKLVDSFTVKR